MKTCISCHWPTNWFKCRYFNVFDCYTLTFSERTANLLVFIISFITTTILTNGLKRRKRQWWKLRCIISIYLTSLMRPPPLPHPDPPVSPFSSAHLGWHGWPPSGVMGFWKPPPCTTWWHCSWFPGCPSQPASHALFAPFPQRMESPHPAVSTELEEIHSDEEEGDRTS